MMLTIRIYRIAIYTRHKLARPGAGARECVKDTNYLRRTRFNGIVNHLLPLAVAAEDASLSLSFLTFPSLGTRW